MTSPDGVTWTSRTSAADNDWQSVCWAPEIGLFCAVSSTGTGNRVMTSPNGLTWTIRTSAADNTWTGITWAAQLGLFCAAAASGTGNRVMCSLPAYPVVYSATNAVYYPSVGTTASAANAFLNSASSPVNQLLRSTSSLRYKTDIENLDPARADAILQMRPVWYRSLADADRKDWSWYGLIAEEVAEVEPRLVHYAPDESGTLVPDGVQYDRLTVLLLDVIKRQRTRLLALEAAVAALQAR
jgi:hypothetical protein